MTAFPCTGCVQCGAHTDAYYDPQLSTTSYIPTCFSDNPCSVSQSYTEGSTWHGIKVVDKLWVGHKDSDQLVSAKNIAVNFTFACQTSETGLFRTQLADGIMGMSNSPDTLPHLLFQNGITKSKIFSLCFKQGGGILTLGGVDQRIHKRNTSIQYLKLVLRNEGWYGVSLKEIRFQNIDSVNLPENYKVSSGEMLNVIIDSGTTDTYLPSIIGPAFKEQFELISGVEYKPGSTISLSEEVIKKLPNIIFIFDGVYSEPVEIVMTPSNYMETVSEGRYVFRVYLNENAGAVLGANFMNNHNIIFDVDSNRIGIATSTCDYEDFQIVDTYYPTAKPTLPPFASSIKVSNCSEETIRPISPCSSTCDNDENSAYIVNGTQEFIDICSNALSFFKTCTETCQYGKHVRGNPKCPDTPWSPCSESCTSTRQIVLPNKPLFDENNMCNYVNETRSCYSNSCPINKNDYLVNLEMRINVPTSKWSYVHSEIIIRSLSQFVKVKDNFIELKLISSPFSSYSKIRALIRLNPSFFMSTANSTNETFTDTLTSFTNLFSSDGFSELFIDIIAQDPDEIAAPKFTFLNFDDIKFSNIFIVPLSNSSEDGKSNVDDDELLENNDLSSTVKKFPIVFISILAFLIGTMIIICVLGCLYYQLKQENQSLRNNSSNLKEAKESLKKAWKKISSFVNGDNNSDRIKFSEWLKKAELDRDLEMSKAGLMSTIEEEDEWEDL